MAVERFAGTVESLALVPVEPLVEWVSTIDDWPKPRRNGATHVTDRKWHGFGEVMRSLVGGLLAKFPDCVDDLWILSHVSPGHRITPHRDEQSSSWRCRVHVPIISNAQSRFIVGDSDHQMVPGMAYRVNTEAVHSVTNEGSTPRVHFMFDVRGS